VAIRGSGRSHWQAATRALREREKDIAGRLKDAGE
jgi:hypothetical protein